MPAAELPSGLVTFWFTDIEGSTRLLQELGHDVFTSVLEEHNRILEEIVGPALVSTEGDSFFCVFESPTEAVQAAVEAQRQIETHSWPDRKRVRVRLGMHTGQARFGGADYVGLDVHRAARISAAGHGGQILLSDSTRALVSSDLPEGTSFTDLGEHELKDLLRPEHLFQLTIEGLQASFPPVVSKGSGDIRVPEPATEFVGREAAIQEVVERLADSRLVTLAGMGGVGKTRLALQAVRSGQFATGNSVFFVGLADTTDGTSIAKTVAEAMALNEQAGRPIEETLIEYLSGRADLLIFDNCEHLVGDVAALTERLLRRCPGLRILTTSREALLIDGERIVAVAPMNTGEDADGSAGRPSDSERLFAVRAGAVSPGFDLTQWADEVAAICSRLEGIPLAIELAAARVPLLTPAEILELLENRFSVLTTRRRGADPRHQTLEATLDWSYELLEPDLRQLLCQLSVFRGGFSRESAAQVCYEGIDDPLLVLDRLTALHERSLLQRTVISGRTRFHLLETVREYAQAKLEDGPGSASAFARHRSYFVDFVREQTSRLGGRDQLEALEMLETDHDNVRAAIDRAVSSEELEVAVDLAGRLSWFWYVHGHFREGERRAEGLLEVLPDQPDRNWLRLLTASAQFDYRLGHFDRAELKLLQAVEHSSRLGETRLEMWARAYTATNDMFRMNFVTGKEEAGRALALAEELGDLIAFGYARMVEIGGAAALLEARDELTSEPAAEMRSELAPMADLARGLGERNIVGHVLEVEGILSFRSGDLSGARTAFDQSIVALVELGTIGCACHCLEAIAFCVAEFGMLEDGVRLIGASDGLREMVGVKVAPMEEPFRTRPLKLATRAWSSEQIRSVRQSGVGLSSREALQVARDVLTHLTD